MCMCIPTKCQLMVSAICHDLNYKDLMSMCVCGVNNKDCMLHRCDEWPDICNFESFIQRKVAEKHHDATEIKFKLWKSTLEDEELDVDEFVE